MYEKRGNQTSSRSRHRSLLSVTLMLAFAATLLTAFTLYGLSLESTTHAKSDAARPSAARRPMAIAPANLQTTYTGESSLTQSLRDNKAQPLTLASADFDEDGMPDLVTGYATTNGGGIVTIQRGNVHALFHTEMLSRDGIRRCSCPPHRLSLWQKRPISWAPGISMPMDTGT